MQRMGVRRVEAADERQYMIHEGYEVYEKVGAPTGAAAFHCHDFYEIIYVAEGEFFSMVENRSCRMKKGDFLLIDRHVMHKYEFEKERQDHSRRIIVWITRQMLEGLSEGKMDLAECFGRPGPGVYHFPVYYEEMLRGYLMQLALSQMRETGEAGAKEVLDKGFLTLFFVYLNVLCSRQEYGFVPREAVEHPMVEQVAAYIEGHLQERILLEDLAEHVHMSKYYFLRRFKELTGVTVHAYVTGKRLIRAGQEIRAGGSVSQACQAAGFGEYSSFLRNFKKTFGVSPGEYREFCLRERI